MSVCVCVCVQQDEVFPISLHNQDKMHIIHFCWALDFSPSRFLFNEKLHNNSNNWINTSINCNMQFEGSEGDWIMFGRFIILHWWILCYCRRTKKFLKCVLIAEGSYSHSHSGILALSPTPAPRERKQVLSEWWRLQTFLLAGQPGIFLFLDL